MHPALAAIIEATPGDHLTFLVTKSGKPYSGKDFGETFRKWCDEAGLPGRCNFHGLRKAGATWLADLGLSPHVIAAWLGHRSLKMVEVYTRAADQRRAAVAGLKAALENEMATAVVTSSNNVTKTGS